MIRHIIRPASPIGRAHAAMKRRAHVKKVNLRKEALAAEHDMRADLLLCGASRFLGNRVPYADELSIINVACAALQEARTELQTARSLRGEK